MILIFNGPIVPTETYQVLALIKSALAYLFRLLRRRRAEAAAARAPDSFESVEQSAFDDVLSRISAADPNDTIFRLLANSASNLFFTPEFLRTANVQAWLAEPEVKRALCDLARSRLLVLPLADDVRNEVERRYRDIAMANRQESAGIVDAVVAMLAAGVKASVADSGTASLVVGVGTAVNRNIELLNAKLDGLHVVSERISTSVSLSVPLDETTTAAWRDALRRASTALLRWPTTLADGAYIERPELAELAGRVCSEDSAVVALLGSPGSGKSALLSKLAQALSTHERMAVLAIKGDLLEPEVENEEGLQRSLRLPELPSVMVRRLALTGPVALLIDQLDALAGHLDAKTGRLSALLNLVKTVSDTRGVFVFVSCRAFEFTHDIRLSQIGASSIMLELPPWEAVLPILEAAGVQAGGFNSDARELMRAPQHLSIFLRLRAEGIQEPGSNYTLMLDRLWQARVLSVPGSTRLASLAFELAEKMAEKEVLWLAPARYDERVKDIDRLKAAGILTTNEQGAVGFSHQTVFEHVLARSFAKNEGGLSGYVLKRNESLFVRPKVWAALTYLRDVEQETYAAELAALWSAPGLRKHLRFLLIDFMGSQVAPIDKEELLLAEASACPELRPLVLKAITGSPGWFFRFGKSLIAEAMIEESTADLCIPSLAAAWRFAFDMASELVLERWVPDEAHDSRTVFVFLDVPKWSSVLVEAAKKVVRRSKLHLFWADHLVSTVGAIEPIVAIELLRAILDGELSRRTTEARRLKDVAERERPVDGEADVSWYLEHNPCRPIENLLEDSQSWSDLPALAAVAASQFVHFMWPWYVEVFEWLRKLSPADSPRFGYPLPYKADFRFDGEEGERSLPASPLLEAISVAVSDIAKTAPNDLITWTQAQYDLELAPIQRLIAHALAANPGSTSSTALRFLLDDERRYFLGNGLHASSTTLALVAACAPFWSIDETERYVETVRQFSPARPADLDAADDIKHWHAVVKRTRLNLLGALPMSLRPAHVTRELDEAARAFPPKGTSDIVTSGWVGPAMSVAQLALASDEDIVNAFKKIPDASEWDHPRRFLLGGNVQLSRQFAEFAKEYPSRAIEVIGRLQPDYAQRAVGYAIAALAEKAQPEIVVNLILTSCQRGFDNEEFRQSVAYAIDKLLERKTRINDEVISILERWIPKVPSVSTPREGNAGGEETEGESGFLLSGGPSTRVLPGGDYSILSSLIRARMSRDEHRAVIRVLRSYLDASHDPEVWELLTDFMSPLAWEESGSGVRLIGDVFSTVRLEGTRGAAVLMAKAHWKALDEVLASLPRWRYSPKAIAQKGYGELLMLIVAANPGARQAEALLNELVETPDCSKAREGATATAVQLLWLEPQFRTVATDWLLRLLKKDEEAVWHQIYGLFNMVDALEPEDNTLRLVREIAERIDRAPAPREPYVVERLFGLLPRYADLVARITSKLIQLWRDRLTSTGSSFISTGQEMMDLALTLHRTDGTKLQGLQMFEQLVEIDAHQSREVLNELDHRVKFGAKPLRPRLRHRRRRARRAS